MTSSTLLQTATGGSPRVVALAFVGLFVTAVSSLVVAYLIVRGYRRNRDPARLYLAVGLVLLTTAPIALQFALTNVGVPAGVRSAAANASKLLGLAAMLYAVYVVSRPPDASRPRRTRGPDRDAERSDEVES